MLTEPTHAGPARLCRHDEQGSLRARRDELVVGMGAIRQTVGSSPIGSIRDDTGDFGAAVRRRRACIVASRPCSALHTLRPRGRRDPKRRRSSPAGGCAARSGSHRGERANMLFRQGRIVQVNSARPQAVAREPDALSSSMRPGSRTCGRRPVPRNPQSQIAPMSRQQRRCAGSGGISCRDGSHSHGPTQTNAVRVDGMGHSSLVIRHWSFVIGPRHCVCWGR